MTHECPPLTQYAQLFSEVNGWSSGTAIKLSIFNIGGAVEEGDQGPEKNGIRRIRWYSIITYVLLIFVASFIGLGQALIANEAGVSVPVYKLFTGTPRVVQSTDILHLRFIRRVASVELVFSQPLDGEGVTLPSRSAHLDAHWEPDTPRVLRFSESRGEPSDDPEYNDAGEAGTLLQIEARMSRAFIDHRPSSRELNAAIIDGQPVEPYELLDQFIDRDRSSLYLYYPLALGNLSNEAAHRFGPYLLAFVMGSLLSLAICQLLLAVITFRWSPTTVRRYLAGQADVGEVPLVDRLANEWAIPLGLFGTALGVWLALEQPGIAYASFADVLGILRFAIFSTVLGIGTKLVCRLRGAWATEATE